MNHALVEVEKNINVVACKNYYIKSQTQITSQTKSSKHFLCHSALMFKRFNITHKNRVDIHTATVSRAPEKAY